MAVITYAFLYIHVSRRTYAHIDLWMWCSVYISAIGFARSRIPFYVSLLCWVSNPDITGTRGHPLYPSRAFMASYLQLTISFTGVYGAIFPAYQDYD